jgi:peroxiredoxin
MDTNNSDAVRTNRWVDERLSALNRGEEWRPNVNAAYSRLNELRATAGWVAKRGILVAAASVVAICLCVMAYPSPKVFAHRCLECTVAVWQSLAPSASIQASLPPENARKAAPEFILNDSNDKAVSLLEQKGKVVLVNFWATWCHGCQLEIPWYVEFQKKYANQGLVVIGISMDDDGWKSVRPWLDEKKVNYPIVIGNESLGKQYGLDSEMPLTALVDRGGRIANLHTGVVDKAATEKEIQVLLQEKAGSARK